MDSADDINIAARIDQSDEESLNSHPSKSSTAQGDASSKSEYTSASSPEAYPEEQRDVERWSTQIIDALAACDFDNPIMQRLVPEFKSDRETVEGVEYQPKSKAEYFAKHRNWAKNVPTRTMTVLHVVSDYHEDKGRAEVWVWLNITGWGSARMCAESVSCFKWQRSQGIWWCHQHTGLRGTPPIQASY
ncbi:hypothetical protein M409DRAFT_50348 [Zasmidium cellare ATCC 36951]|uniref:SnoaL-like domain-containing protein n=1 Tax=Zasmidium cellare ATCC 36951 TaxID=1080233 RepID=A0A6A6D234_ZASCE|nr:uncharacterized protein M409DRAFT_50348 [Zasmidium cellare ATCC 36951]KAF2171686.1 hypothetical protein M409DRAFT_50348 [Zasmidium cellare ATCC 36951]